jgi:RecB family exonuclease
MSKKNHSIRKHSHFAASAASRWLSCPGSVELCKKAPPQKMGFHAREGTQAHECLEFIVKRWSNSQSAKAQAEKKWNLEMVEHAIVSAKIIHELRPHKDAELLIEKRVTLPISKQMFGTLDYGWVHRWGELVVIDYKYGAGIPVLPVDEETKEPNPQLMYYALGLAHKHHYDFDVVRLGIIQPRVWRDDPNPLTQALVTIKMVRQFEERVREAVEIANSPNAPLNPSEEACRYCPASTICPALSKKTLASIDVAFDVDEGMGKLPDVKQLTPERLPKVLDACDLLEHWINSVRVQAFVMANEGEKIEGRKLVQKRSTRSWLPEAEKLAKQTFGSKAFRTEFLSPAQLEKEFGKPAKDFTTKYTSNISTGLVLVKASDRRPEASPNPFEIDETQES